jgi:DNA segregation ATPase FtsK/SpoIIIE, S-DNA-T family
MEMIRFWKNWDDAQRATAVRVAGLLMAAFTLFSLLSVLSYFFTWQRDQSLLTDPALMDSANTCANLAGKMGLKWSRLLVYRWFGLGSLALVALLAALSVRLLTRKYRIRVLRTVLVTITGAFVTSLLFALAGHCLGLGTVFGGGLGGECGASLITHALNLIGLPASVLATLLLVVLWLLFASPRFLRWFNGLFSAKDRDAEPAPEETAPEKPVAAAKPEPVKTPEPVRIPKPEPVPEPVKAVAQTAQEVASINDPVPEAVTEGLSEIERGEALNTEVSKPLPRINVRIDPPEGLPDYKLPSLDLLKDYAETREEVSDAELTKNNNIIRAVLSNYNIEVRDVKAIVGPTVTLYKVYPAPGVKIASVRSRSEDIAMSLNARGVRIVLLGDAIGIEVANDKPATVPLKALLNSDAFRKSKAELPVAIGCNIQKEVRVFDLADAPHLLVAGATKQGKSVGLNVLVSSLLYAKHPSEMKLVFIDPKMVEFSAYARLLKHYLAVLPSAGDEEEEMSNAIVKDPKNAEKILRSLCMEMDQRYALLSKSLVNKVTLYNEKYLNHKLLPTEGHRYLPYIVVIIDEYADLAMSGGSGPEGRALQRSIMSSIVRLAQKGRAAGIHVVIATQRPSVDVITGLIKANFPARIAFRVSTRVDSNTILDTTGAEKLIGRGDMIYYAGVDTERIQCGFISNDEINDLTAYIGSQKGYRKEYNTPYYLPDPCPEGQDGSGAAALDVNELDERFVEAAELVVNTQRGSTSDLQRRLGMGYAKAGRVMDQLEQAGIVGPQEGSKPRKVLVASPEELEDIIKSLG